MIEAPLTNAAQAKEDLPELEENSTKLKENSTANKNGEQNNQEQVEIENAIVKDNQVAPNSKQVNNDNQNNANDNSSTSDSDDINKKVIINVPQGCYAIVTKDTPKNIVGVMTDGLISCSCVIITDEDRENFVLAHVDGYSTNIGDPSCGLPKWVQIIRELSGNKKINIYCTSGIWPENVKTKVDYKSWIEKILTQNNLNDLSNNVRQATSIDCAACLIMRKNSKITNIKLLGITHNIPQFANEIYYNCDGDKASGLSNYLSDTNNVGYFNIVDCYVADEWRNAGMNSDEGSCSYSDEIKKNDGYIREHAGQYQKLQHSLNNLNTGKFSFGEPVPFPPICCLDRTLLRDSKTYFNHRYGPQIQNYLFIMITMIHDKENIDTIIDNSKFNQILKQNYINITLAK